MKNKVHTTNYYDAERKKEFARALTENYVAKYNDEKLHLEGDGSTDLGAWFIGTKGENSSLFKDLVQKSIDENINCRKEFHPDDPYYITEEVKNSEGYKSSINMLAKEFDKLVRELKASTPFYSFRILGHMNWEISMPAVLGYMAALLYNQNNVAAEASPTTTILEMLVGNDLCKMLGFTPSPIKVELPDTASADALSSKQKITAWGHITADGSIANIEGMWASRNLKYYPVSVRAALKEEPKLAKVRDITIKLCTGETKQIISLTDWEALNIEADEILAIPSRVTQMDPGIDTTTFGNIVENYSLQSLGFVDLTQKYLTTIKKAPVAIGPSTMHYSWPKGAAILGIGKENLIDVHVDKYGRIETTLLKEKLQRCLDTKTPVIMNIVVIGTTEEGSIDPLDEILEMRDEFRKKGLEYTIHLDAAWGGYFASMIRPSTPEQDEATVTGFIPDLPLSKYAIKQYRLLGKADSITVDPHKAGYVPYPAGGLCYRNSAMRNLVTFTAPVVFHGGFDPTVGVYGIEGSKPGAAAAATYLSHRVIRPDITGYGKILGECMFTAKKLYARLLTMNKAEYSFNVIPLLPTVAELEGKSEPEIEKQLHFIETRINHVSNEEIIKDPEAMNLLRELGQDQTICTYFFNFKNDDGTWNQDAQKMYDLNQEVFNTFSLAPGDTFEEVKKKNMIVTSSVFSKQDYGEEFVNGLLKRAGFEHPEKVDTPIFFIITTLMDPWPTDSEMGNFLNILEDTIFETVNGLIKNKAFLTA